MYSVITITLNPALDISTTVQTMQPDKKMRCAAPVAEPGGGGVNVSRVLDRFGEKSLPVYFEGGGAGSRLTHLLTTDGMASFPIPITGETRENIHISDISTGRQYRFVMPGPIISQAEHLALLAGIADLMADTQYVVVSGSFPRGTPPDFMEKLSALAGIHDARVIADLSGDGLRQATMAGVYLIKPNLGELAALANRDELSERAAIEAAQNIIAAGGATVVSISMGAAGAILVTGDQVEKIPAPLVKTLSTVGAGDSMVAGIIAGLINGYDITAAVRYGVACGTAATLAKGTGLCRKTDADRLYQQMMRQTARET